MNTKYSVKLTYPNGRISYLSHRNRMAWCKRTARKHMTEFLEMVSGLKAELEES